MATTISFHILSMCLLIIQFDVVYSELLAALLNKLEISTGEVIQIASIEANHFPIAMYRRRDTFQLGALLT